MPPKKKASKRPTKKKQRPIGLAKGKVKLGKSFFEPLPNDLHDAFEGRSPITIQKASDY
jgi:hypothetical protein